MKKFGQTVSSFGLFIFLISLLAMPLGGLSMVSLEQNDVLSVSDSTDLEEEDEEKEELEEARSDKQKYSTEY